MAEHPITPPPELVGKWLWDDGYPWDPSENATITISTNRLRNVATQAARWGADQELEACCEWVSTVRACWMKPEALRTARRPKSPSLRTALQELVEEVSDVNQYTPPGVLRAIENARRALEQLND